MNCSTPGLPVHHRLPEFTQTHVHRVGDAIQPPHPLSSPSPPALNLSKHQGLFQWVTSSHEVVKVLEFQLQHQSFQFFKSPHMSEIIHQYDVFVFLWLISLSLMPVLSQIARFSSFNGCIIFHCVYLSYFPYYSLIKGHRLFPYLGYYKKCCNEHGGAYTFGV